MHKANSKTSSFIQNLLNRIWVKLGLKRLPELEMTSNSITITKTDSIGDCCGMQVCRWWPLMLKRCMSAVSGVNRL